MVGGVEYTFFQVAVCDAVNGVLGEIHFDNCGTNPASTRPFEHDTFLGSRLGLNDKDDTLLLFGAVIYAHDSTLPLFGETQRRIGDSW